MEGLFASYVINLVLREPNERNLVTELNLEQYTTDSKRGFC